MSTSARRATSLFATPIIALALGQFAPAARADTPLSLAGANSLTASGNVNGFLALTAQGPGANVTTYSGPVTLSDFGMGGPGTFSFVSANLVAANSGTWAPAVGGGILGAPGMAPANYGLRQTTLGALASVRNGRFGITSGPLTLSGGASNTGTFPASQVTLSVLQGDNDYNAGALGIGAGTLTGLTSPAAAAGVNGNIQISGSTMTLTLPINATISQLLPGTSFTVSVTLSGTLTATGPAPALPTGACCRGSTCAVTTAVDCPAAANQSFTAAGTACNAAGNTMTPCCKADFNKSGPPPTVQDIFDFLAAYFASDPYADINGGGTSVQDIFDFLAAYFAGCS